ncbi:MAG: hypothetical protein GY810_29465 [Aureispira sp.]|nr:hypothetical protein [Aureispira sp.]
MSHLDNKINEELPLDEAIQKVLDQLIKDPRPISPSEVTHLTGIGHYEASRVLRELMERYPSRLDVNEKGELIYDFNLEGHTEPELPWNHYPKLILGFVFRLWIVLMLYTIGILYGLMISIIALFMGVPQVFGYFGAGLVLGIKELIASISNYSKPQENGPLVQSQKPSLLKDVFAYAFGRPYIEDKLVVEKRILGYLRKHDYLISNTELVLLTGWSWNKAREEATNLVVQYSGTVEVSDSGYVLYRFDAIKLTEEEEKLAQKEAQGTQTLFIWDRFLPRYGPDVLNPKTRGYITLSIGSIFTIAAIYSLFADPFSNCFWQLSIDSFIPWHENAFCISFWSSYFPLVFCFIYLKLGRNLQKKDIQLKSVVDKQQLQNKFLQTVFENLPIVYDKDLTELETELMDTIRVDLEGFPSIDEQGNTYNEFSLLHEELNARNLSISSISEFSLGDYEPIKKKRFLLPADKEQKDLESSVFMFWLASGAAIAIVYFGYLFLMSFASS